MTIKEQYAANLMGHWDFRTGTINDQSGNGNNASFQTGGVWGNSDKGRALGLKALSDYLTVADDSTLQITGEITIAMWVKFEDYPGSSGRLITKGADSFSLYHLGVNQIGIGDDFGFRNTTNFTLEDGKYHLVCATHDGSDTLVGLKLYSDGMAATTYGSSGTFNGWSAGTDLGIGARNTGTGGFGGTFREIMIFNTKLEDSEIAQLYEESLKEAFLTAVPTKTFSPKPYATQDPILPTPIFESDCKPRANKLDDLSGNGNDADINGVTSSEGALGESVEFKGVADQDVSFGNSTMLHDLDRASFCFFLEPTAFGSFDGILTQGTSTTDRTRIGLGGTGFGTNQDILINFANGGTAASAHTTNTPLAADAPVFIRIEFNGHQQENIKLYVNEEKQTLTESGTKAATLSDVNAELVLGNDLGGAGRVLNGHVFYAAVFDQNLTTAQGAHLYHELAQKLNLNRLQEDIIVTPSSVSSGNLSNTGFEVLSGSFDVVVDSEGDKAIECASDGVVSIPSSGAYGRWEATVSPRDSGFVRLGFISNNKEDIGTGGQSGYYVFMGMTNNNIGLTRLINGAATSLFLSANSYLEDDSLYRIVIERDADNEFSVYAQNLSTNGPLELIPANTGSNPVTDANTVASSYTIIQLDTGHDVRNFKYYPLPIDPTA